MMAELTNAERSDRAFRTVLAYVSRGNGDPDDIETSAVDLIADILHMLDKDYSHDADDACRTALMHFHAETGDSD